MKFRPSSDDERKEMLAAIGVSSVVELFADVPEPVRAKSKPRLGPPLSEIELRRLFGGLASRNADARGWAHFLGAGCYHHYVPAIADQMLVRE